MNYYNPNVHEWDGSKKEDRIEHELNNVAEKNKDFLNSRLILPLDPNWQFCTNGLYLLLATAGCGKSRFIIKHIRMCDDINHGQPYYQQIVYVSTSGELDETVQSNIDAGIIKTNLIQIKDKQLLEFLKKHLKRKRKYYSMVKYLKQDKITPRLQKYIDKHMLKFLVPDKKKLTPTGVWDSVPTYSTGTVSNNNHYIYTCPMKEKVNKPKLLKYISNKIEKYGYDKPIVPVLIVLDDFAGHPLIERKETELCKIMTKCRHYNTTFIIAVQTSKYVIRNIKRQATDIVLWSGINEEDFFDLMKNIQYSYDQYTLWNRYKNLKNQKDHLILNIKAHTFRFIEVL